MEVVHEMVQAGMDRFDFQAAPMCPTVNCKAIALSAINFRKHSEEDGDRKRK